MSLSGKRNAKFLFPKHLSTLLEAKPVPSSCPARMALYCVACSCRGLVIHPRFPQHQGRGDWTWCLWRAPNKAVGQLGQMRPSVKATLDFQTLAGSRLCASKKRRHLCRSMVYPRKGQAVHPSFVGQTSRLVLRGHKSLGEFTIPLQRSKNSGLLQLRMGKERLGLAFISRVFQSVPFREV